MKGRFFLQIPLLLTGFYYLYTINVVVFYAVLGLFIIYSILYSHYFLKETRDKSKSIDDLEHLASEEFIKKYNEKNSSHYFNLRDTEDLIWWDVAKIYKNSKNPILMFAFIPLVLGATLIGLPKLIFDYLDDKLTI
jgi:hypothetical protein